MKKIKKITLWICGILIVLYLAICILYYFSQEKILFDTSVKLTKNHTFKFSSPFEEREIQMQDGKKLSGILFKANESKGLILFLPGGRGMIDSLGVNAHIYTDLNYDLFILNYRGFGKSEGEIKSEKEFNQDMQTVYDTLKKEYSEEKIILWGYSLGTGPAAALAKDNFPRMLILQAPYYSMKELSSKAFPYLPISIIQKYKFPINDYLKDIKSQIIIIHGDADKRIPVDVSYRLEKLLKPTDDLIVLKKQGHNGFEQNEEFLSKISKILE